MTVKYAMNKYSHSCLLGMVINRAGLSILQSLDMFNSNGPPKPLHTEAIFHYLTIHKQRINTRSCMHTHTILTLFVKSTVSYCYCVHTAVSVSYSICYHMHNNEIVFGIVTNTYYTQLPYLMCII